jgi:predicted transcriptional regulator
MIRTFQCWILLYLELNVTCIEINLYINLIIKFNRFNFLEIKSMLNEKPVKLYNKLNNLI